jgi:hypothetical protein
VTQKKNKSPKQKTGIGLEINSVPNGGKEDLKWERKEYSRFMEIDMRPVLSTS